MNVFVVVNDCGTLQEESSYFTSINHYYKQADTLNKNNDFGIQVPNYVEENVSTKVGKLIQSYTGVVNKIVWRK